MNWGDTDRGVVVLALAEVWPRGTQEGSRALVEAIIGPAEASAGLDWVPLVGKVSSKDDQLRLQKTSGRLDTWRTDKADKMASEKCVNSETSSGFATWMFWPEYI